MDFRIIDRLDEAPADPEEGDEYIVLPDAIDDWAGWDNHVARFADGAWEEIVPQLGQTAYVVDEEKTVTYVDAPDYWADQQFWRERLAAPRTYYVRSDGDDANDGLTEETAVETLQAAVDAAALVDTDGYDVTFDCAEAATFGGVSLKRLYGGGRGIIVGLNSANTIIDDDNFAVLAHGDNDREGVGSWELSKVKLTGGFGLQARGDSQIEIGEDVDFGECSNAHINALDGALVWAATNYKISGDATAHMVANGGVIDFTCGVTVSNNPEFSSAFVQVLNLGRIYRELYFSGDTGTGKQFIVESGVVSCGPGNAFLGDVVGETKPGGTVILNDGAVQWTSRRDNLAATTDPATSDDADDYYAVGSKWVNTTLDKSWICLDATAGAAVWRQTGLKNDFEATVEPTVNDDESLGFQIGSRIFMPAVRRGFVCIDDADGAAVWEEERRNEGRNYIVNGGPQIWQRGTSFASGAGQYTADRWKFGRSTNAAGATLSQQTGFAGSPYCMRLQRDNGDSATDEIRAYQAIHSSIARMLRGKYVVMSYWARYGANWSASGLTLSPAISTGTGVDESPATNTANPGYTGQVGTSLDSQAISSSGAWVKHAPILLASDLNEVCIRFRWTPSGTAGAADYIDIERVKLEVGYHATEMILDLEHDTYDRCCFFYEAKTVRTENGARHIPLVRKRISPTVGVSAGSSGNVTVNGFELSHSSAANCNVTADAEI